MDLFEAIEKRRSVRKFKPDQVKEENLKRILEAGRLAPSGGNRQPWYFIVVRDLETKNALAIASNDQKFVAEADTVIVALGDSGVYPKKATSSTRILHKQDPMIAIEHMVLASTALGYGTCWIGAFSEAEIKKILKVPENVTVVALLPVGVPAESPPPRPRKPFDEIFFRDSYGTPLRL
jgi:nitroreductase